MVESGVFREHLPRCERMDGSTLRIVSAYTEAGMFQEANCVTITDGERTAVYVPLVVDDARPDAIATNPVSNEGHIDAGYLYGAFTAGNVTVSEPVTLKCHKLFGMFRFPEEMVREVDNGYNYAAAVVAEMGFTGRYHVVADEPTVVEDR